MLCLDVKEPGAGLVIITMLEASILFSAIETTQFSDVNDACEFVEPLDAILSITHSHS